MEKSKVIFGNSQPGSVYRKAVNSKKKYAKKFGDDSDRNYSARVVENQYIGDLLGVKNISVGDASDGTSEGFDSEKGIIVGNIRMGFGHYRISMAIASAANALGYVPYWMDLNSYKDTTCTKVISAQNDLYSMGSRISQKSKLFNKIVWEPLNYEGFRKLSYNAADQKNAELMAPVYKNVPKDIPVVATHVWPAQAAIHAGMRNVVNAIPDNWPMALHFAEGSIHTVQTHYAYQGYRICNGMDGDKVLNPMPAGSLKYVGHYIDHELVANIEDDCARRMARKSSGKPMRFLLTIGGAGAQKEIFADTKVFVQDALAKVEELNRFRLLVPMMDRQIATAKVQLAWMVKDFKTVDALMPKVLLVDPMMAAIKIARLHMTGGDFKEIEKLYRKGVGRVRYNGNVLLAAEMSWIQVKRGDADGAFKTLTEALKKSDDATLKRNHECLMNNRVGHFSNSGLGDQWYSLLLEEPKVHVQRQRSVYR